MGYNTRNIGNRYEDMAASYLTKKGHSILKRNFSCRHGEIDIISTDKDTLVFTEVKFRTRSCYGYPEEAVNYHKQMQICKTALYYMTWHGYGTDTPIRFDVVTVYNDKINHIENAFYYAGKNMIF